MAEFFLNNFPLINEVVGFDIQMRITDKFSYFGLWYNDSQQCTPSEFSSFFSTFFAQYPDRFTLLLDKRIIKSIPFGYQAKGFLCYSHDGSIIDLFDDDIRSGKLYYCYNEDEEPIGRIVFGQNDFDYTVQHDPLLKALELVGD